MAQVTIDGAGKVFPDGTVAVHRVDLDIDDGELLAIVGASGCGKTTVLRMVAGFEDPSWGNIRFDGEIVDRVRVQQRGLAMLFQECAVYPHLDVAANLGFPLKMAGVHHREIARRVDDVAHRLGIADTLDRRPSRLSGGERQRVALGRAIIRDPSILLMDEPMSNVDAKLRTELRTQLTVLQRQLGVTTLLVTHDQVEALSMGHRVAVMRAGEVVQCATPRDLYEAPADVGVATFVGSPPMNVLAGVVDRSAADGDAVRIGAQSIPIDATAWPDVSNGAHVGVGFRPEDIGFRDDGGFTVEIVGAEHVGAHHVVDLAVAASGVTQEHDQPDVAPTPRAIVRATVPAHAAPDPWRPVHLAIEPARLELFDLETGRRLPRLDAAGSDPYATRAAMRRMPSSRSASPSAKLNRA